MSQRVLSICTGMGLMDRAFMDAGFDVEPGCEIDPQKRQMYTKLCGGRPHLCHDLKELPGLCDWMFRGQRYAGIIGGPSCQFHSKLRAMRNPKFPDLTPLVLDLLKTVPHDWFWFENVVPIDIPGAVHTRCNAMHYYQPHQSRSRWFTHSPNIKPPQPVYSGSVDDLMAYSVVAGRIYGRGLARSGEVLDRLRKLGVNPWALRLTADRVPWHPLMLPYSCKTLPMFAALAQGKDEPCPKP